MKLYTEEQIREAIKMAREGVLTEDNIINSLNFIKPPIELPSNEEIEKKAHKFYSKYRETAYEKSAYALGAMWVLEKLTRNTKEK